MLYSFYDIYKETKSKEYKKGYYDYPNDDIYKMCLNYSNKSIRKYKNGWNAAKSDDERNKEKEIINKIIN